MLALSLSLSTSVYLVIAHQQGHQSTRTRRPAVLCQRRVRSRSRSPYVEGHAMQRQSSNATQRSRTQQKQHGSFQSSDDDTCSCSLAAEGYTGPRRVDHPNSYDTIDTLELRESAAKNFLAALTISRPPAGRHALRSDAGPYEQAEELGCLATSSSGRHGLLLSLASSGLRF